MRKLFTVAAVGMMFLSLVSVSAQDGQDIGLSRDYNVCMDKSGGVTLNMLNCIDAETKRQDARLNKIYKEVMAAQMDDGGKKRLLEAQRAWIKFRDADVDFYRDPNGGTAATLAGSDRYLTMTAQRAAELENFKQ
jgi:uncharacterized protein YecT (DUF1311 family)